MRSIQRYILASSTLLTLIAGTALLFGSLYSINHETEEVFDASLVQSAQLIQVLLPNDTTAYPLPPFNNRQRIPLGLNEDQAKEIVARFRHSSAPAHHYENKLAFLIRDRHGNRLLASPEPFDLPAPQETGFQLQQSTGNGLSWRTYSLFDGKREIWITSAHQLEVRQELTLEIAEHVIPPLLVITLLLLLSITWVARRGLSPLRKISEELNQRSSQDFSPISDETLPSELQAPVNALNAMFRRVEAALQRERRFTDDAAHELRTPLATMRVYLDRLTSDRDTTQALSQGVGRMERLVQQLLQLARLEPHQRDRIRFSHLELSDACAEIIADIYPQAALRQMQIELHGQSPCPTYGEKTLLQVLVRNLLENAIRYSKPGDCIQVYLHRSPEKILLKVTDHGPGLSEEEKAQVFQRFYRSNKADSLGAGLGLAIVETVVELHHGSYRLQDTENGGLTVCVELPQP